MWLAALLIVAAGLCAVNLSMAQDAPAAQADKVREFNRLLADPEVQSWLQQQLGSAPSAKPNLAERERRAIHSIGAALSGRFEGIRLHIRAMVAAVPRAPGEIAAAILKVREVKQETDSWGVLALVIGFVLIGLAAVWIFRMATSRVLRWTQAVNAAAPRQRLMRLLVRFILAAAETLVFALASAGFFLSFTWPALLHDVVVLFLAAAVTTKTVFMVLGLFLSPHDEAVRPVPMNTPKAVHFYSRIGLFAGWLAFGYAFVDALRGLDIDQDVSMLIAYMLGIGLVAIAIEMVWRRPNHDAAPEAGAIPLRHKTAVNWTYTLLIVALWSMWVLAFMRMFWLALALVTVPVLLRQMRRMVFALFSTDPAVPVPEVAPGVMAALVERILRAAIILFAIWLLAAGWDITMTGLAAEADGISRISRSLLIVLIILLSADLAWQLLKTVIDAAIAAAQIPGPPGTSEEIRRAKIRTLLPPIRNVTLFFLVTLAIFMSLSTMGVEIGPLIASAGVVGVAIGFGAQTLFKDIISGMFYLLDDAFRIGEYIVAGDYKGTVESFSLRSVRLRHHRGPIYTVPFGSLGAVQNLSRDFVIDKFVLNVTYDSDLELARKILKDIGKELAADPELAPLILEPLKMQAVGDIGDAGVQIKVKMMCIPGGQYMVRKKAYPLIKKRFEENGIQFAYPTVKIADDSADGETMEDQKAAVARALARRKTSAKPKPV